MLVLSLVGCAAVNYSTHQQQHLHNPRVKAVEPKRSCFHRFAGAVEALFEFEQAIRQLLESLAFPVQVVAQFQQIDGLNGRMSVIP